MIRTFSILLLCRICFGQSFGESQPFLAGANNVGCPGGINPLSVPGLVVWVDVYHGVTNNAGSSSPSNGDTIKGWQDLSTNQFPFLNFGSASSQPAYSATLGPTNGPCLIFNNNWSGNTFMTNWAGGVTNSQPNTFFWVVWDPGNHTHNRTLWDSMDANNRSYLFSFSTGNFAMEIGGDNGGPPNAVLWSGTLGDGAANFGWNYSWQVLTIQYNGANSFVRINGIGPRSTGVSGPLYNAGPQGTHGFVMGNNGSLNSSAFVYSTSFLWYTGALNTNTMLCLERSLGSEHGIAIP